MALVGAAALPLLAALGFAGVSHADDIGQAAPIQIENKMISWGSMESSLVGFLLSGDAAPDLASGLADSQIYGAPTSPRNDADTSIFQVVTSCVGCGIPTSFEWVLNNTSRNYCGYRQPNYGDYWGVVGPGINLRPVAADGFNKVRSLRPC